MNILNRLFIVIFFLIVGLGLVFTHPVQGAVSIFSDGFENGLDVPTTWTSADSKWDDISNSANAHSGQKRVQVKGNTNGDNVLLKEKSTFGYQSLNLSYWYKIDEKLESGDHLFVEWSNNGASWTQLTDYSNLNSGDWTSASFNLLASASNQSDFRFRFRADLGAGSDIFWLDDVILSGDLIPTPTPTPSNTPTPTPSNTPTPTPSPKNIKGKVFHDFNVNSSKDSDDGNLEGWFIILARKNSSDSNRLEVISIASSSANGNFPFSITATGSYKIFPEKRANWLNIAPASSSTNFDVTYSVNIGSLEFDFSTFYPLEVTSNSSSELRTDSQGRALNFGLVKHIKFKNARVSSLNGDLASASGALFIDPANFNVSQSNGASLIEIPGGLTITKMDGGNFDVTQLDAADVAINNLSGLDPGESFKGAIQWGIPNESLQFSSPITIKIYMGNDFEGNTFNVIRSVNGISEWTNDGIASPTCEVDGGYCTFSATKASYYALTQTLSSNINSSASNVQSGGAGGYVWVPGLPSPNPSPTLSPSSSPLSSPTSSPEPISAPEPSPMAYISPVVVSSVSNQSNPLPLVASSSAGDVSYSEANTANQHIIIENDISESKSFWPIIVYISISLATIYIYREIKSR